MRLDQALSAVQQRSIQAIPRVDDHSFRTGAIAACGFVVKTAAIATLVVRLGGQ
jgi:hypothetical protein